MEIQVPLLAAKALLLLLLFAFVYSVMRRGIGDLNKVPDDKPFRPGSAEPVRGNGGVAHKVAFRRRPGDAAELVVEHSDILAPETRYTVRDGTTNLGRSSASDIVLKSDDFVSGQHARLTRHGGLLYVEDSGSTNGTFVNGDKAVGATPLRSGDLVRVGSTTFRYIE